MLTENGALLAFGMVWCVLAIIFLVMSVRQFMQKGCLLSVVYLCAPEEERHKLQQKRLYQATGYVFLYLFLISLFLGLFFTFALDWFASLATILALSGLLNLLIRFATRDK